MPAVPPVKMGTIRVHTFTVPVYFSRAKKSGKGGSVFGLMLQKDASSTPNPLFRMDFGHYHARDTSDSNEFMWLDKQTRNNYKFHFHVKNKL